MIILSVLIIIGTFKEIDVSSLTEIALASYVEVSASNVWYYKKATRENLLKNNKELINNVDINALL